MRRLRTGLLALLFVCVPVLLSSGAPPTPLYAPGTHKATTDVAVNILYNEGLSRHHALLVSSAPCATNVSAIGDVHTVVLPEDCTYRGWVKQGTIDADDYASFQSRYGIYPWNHGHHPDLHAGWITPLPLPSAYYTGVGNRARPAGFFANLYAQQARNRVRENLAAAFWHLGVALHFLQDASVPQHAEASVASGSCLFDWCDPLLLGNGSHRAYENYVAANFATHTLGGPGRPPAECGIYHFHGWPTQPNGPLVHSNPDDAFGWVDAAAHESLAYWDEVGMPTWLPNYAVHYGWVTNLLLASAERRAAGFLASFLERLGATYRLRLPVGKCSMNLPAFRDAYLRIGGSTTLGSARSVAQPWEGGEIQYFRGGTTQVGAIILSNRDPRAHPTAGTAWRKYVGLIGRIYLGFPISDETAGVSRFGTAVRYQRFDGALWSSSIIPGVFTAGSLEIYQSGPLTGQAFAIHGPIYRKWVELGYEGSCLGLPLGDEYPYLWGFRQNFEGGLVTGLSSDAAYECH